MLIEFSCPACKTQLSVEDKVAGRKVDCPKCKELIIIPVSSDELSKDDQKLPDADVLRSVLPYRAEMLTKHNKLLEAIEEIKLRNERIRELESSSLRIQKELWAIEVEFEQRKEVFDKTEKEKRDLKKKLNQGGFSTSGNAHGEIKALQNELDLAQKQIMTLEKEANEAIPANDADTNKKIEQLTNEFGVKIKALEDEVVEVDKINMALKAEVSGLTIGINQRDAIANQAYQQIQQSLESEASVALLEKERLAQQKAIKGQDEVLNSLVDDAGNLSKKIKELDAQLKKKGQPAKTDPKKTTSATPREEQLVLTVKDLTDALAKSRDAENKALEKVAKLEDRSKSLENKVEDDKNATERLAKISTSYSALEKEHLSLEKKHETVVEEKTKLEANAAQLKKLEQIETENMEYVAQIASQENQVKALQTEIETLRANPPADAPAGKATAKPKGASTAAEGEYNEELKKLQDRLSKMEFTSDELATENARLKNTVRTLTENLKAQWKKRDAKIHMK